MTGSSRSRIYLDPQRVTIEAKHRGGLDLVATGRNQRQPDQRSRSTSAIKNLVIDAGDRHAVVVRGKEIP